MKEADAAQANNLGQALAPRSRRFQELTKQALPGVQLTAHLARGVLAAGAAREID
jgi:hypothetical protein